MTLAREHQAAARIAAEVGSRLLALRGETSDRGELGHRADRLAHELIVAELAGAFPDDAVLSEESSEHFRAPCARTWIVDPLDGTREFTESRTDWAVQLALAVDGAPAVGALALPGRSLVLSTAQRRPRRVGARGVNRILVSRTRPPAFAPALAEAFGAALVPRGSVGAKVAGVIHGEADVYVHAGGQYQWDSAAPVAVASHYGLHASRLDGSPLSYGGPDLRVDDLVVCAPANADRVLETIGSVVSAS